MSEHDHNLFYWMLEVCRGSWRSGDHKDSVAATKPAASPRKRPRVSEIDKEQEENDKTFDCLKPSVPAAVMAAV